MKLLISLTDQSFAATKSIGIFNVSRGLTAGLMQCPEVTELHILGNNECAAAFADCPPHVHLHEIQRPVPQKFGRIAWDQFVLPRIIRRIAPDWALLPKGYPPYFPRLGRTKLACYLHDVNWEYYEKTSNTLATPFPKHELLYFRTLALRALKVSDLVLTSTAFNRERFLSYEPTATTAVVGIGFDTPARTQPPGGRDVLFYASPYPHKLTALGVQRLTAWLAQRQDASDIRIHVIGSLPPGTELPGARWQKHGRIPQQELREITENRCRVSVYFSDYEGFGMPPVESLRSGLPCVASDLPPIRENIPARYLFDNADGTSFIRTMNDAYDSNASAECPVYPTWKQVAQRCVAAMQQH